MGEAELAEIERNCRVVEESCGLIPLGAYGAKAIRCLIADRTLGVSNERSRGGASVSELDEVAEWAQEVGRLTMVIANLQMLNFELLWKYAYRGTNEKGRELLATLAALDECRKLLPPT